jgi:hypothetical protein
VIEEATYQLFERISQKGYLSFAFSGLNKETKEYVQQVIALDEIKEKY